MDFWINNPIHAPPTPAMATQRQLTANRMNAKKAGRPKGAVSEHTKLRILIQEKLTSLAMKRADEIFGALFDKAVGHYATKVIDGQEVRTYSIPPHLGAIQEILNRTSGRPLSIEGQTAFDLEQKVHESQHDDELTDEERALLDRAYENTGIGRLFGRRGSRFHNHTQTHG
jgi:hypothetical protein